MTSLTTAAAVWESAAIGMAAGAGLLLLACATTALHFVIVLGLSRISVRLTNRLRGSTRLHIVYQDKRGVLRQLLQACDAHGWQLVGVATDPPSVPRTAESLSPPTPTEVGVVLTLQGTGVGAAVNTLVATDGVSSIERLDDDTE